MTFLVPDEEGLKVVSYSLKKPDLDKTHRVIVGEHSSVNKSIVVDYKEDSKVYAFLRQECSLAEFLQEQERDKTKEQTLNMLLKENGLSFSYADRDDEGEQKEPSKLVWQSEWQNPYLPLAVHIEMTFVGLVEGAKGITLERTVFIPTGLLGKEILPKTSEQ